MVKLLFFSFIIALSWQLFSRISQPTLPPSPPVTDNNPPNPTSPLHPYALASLPNRLSPDPKITIEKQLSSTPSFESYLVSYISEDLKLFALMNRPIGEPPSPGWPIIIVNHGYIPPQEYSTINSYKNTSAYYASQGFLVLKPDYRGHDQSSGESTRLFSRNQYALDVLNLIAGLDSLDRADTDRIFLYGHSMGGDVSLQIAEISNLIKGVSLWAPAVAPYPQSITYFLNRRRPTPTDATEFQQSLIELQSLYDLSIFSSYANTNLVNIPLIIHHGTADESVPYSWGEDLNQRLQDQAKSVKFYSYQNDNHDIAAHWSLALSRDVEFFKSL